MRLLLRIFFAPLQLITWLVYQSISWLVGYIMKGGTYRAEAYRLAGFICYVAEYIVIGKEEHDKLVDERRQEMAKIFGVKADESIVYVPKSQREDPEKEQVKFKVGFLTVQEYSGIQDELFKSKGFGKKREEQFLLGKQTHLALRKGLHGWENFFFGDGTEVKWEGLDKARDDEDRNRIMDRNLNQIPPDVRTELADYIRGESTLGESE